MLFAALFTSICAAQEPLLGTFLSRDGDGPAWGLSDYSTHCPVSVPNACSAYSYPEISHNCTPAGIDTLGSESPYVVSRYLSSIEFQETEKDTWTCESDAALLLDVSDSSRVVPLWQDATERTFEFIREARLAKHDGAAILDIQYCLNGTGGCFDNLLIGRRGKWDFLRRDSTWSAVYAQLPAGYRTHKSPPIDIEHLTWEQNIAGPHDANCCASGRLHLQLGLIEDHLSVKQARVEADLHID